MKIDVENKSLQSQVNVCCKVLVNNPRQYEYGHKKENGLLPQKGIQLHKC